jgi:hypothetical protein
MARRRSFPQRLAGLALCLLLPALALSSSSCGGGSASPVVSSTPVPTPIPTPTPDPNVPPAGSGCGQPYPPKITRFAIKVLYRLPDYWIVDSTPLVGPDAAYCAAAGFTDGRSICSIRPEGASDRSACELWRAGTSKDTPPRPGPTWTLKTPDGKVGYCTGPASGCDHFTGDEMGPFSIKAIASGIYTVCTADGACAEQEVVR